ncbi:MAG: D-glycero-beta-D-manno-heptose-7-phosphate kinase [Calditrichaeota bacterium]|nr:MAG: D-glycero-beta-D-manno-heptose-7-phosphate kinase [Calditrichota bacterium]
MDSLSEKRLDEIIRHSEGKRILIVGDLMIDRYLWGNVTRISPEAPVPIINIEDEEIRFGGAANVANNIIGLNAEPILVGTVGADYWGEVFRNMLREKNLVADGLIQDERRPTTIKTRIIGNNQHIARVDRERIVPIETRTEKRILDFVKSIISEVDAIILEDYNKGVLIPSLVAEIIRLGNENNLVITVDPKFENFLSYQKVTLFKPNKKETEEALATRLGTEEEIRLAGKLLLQKLEAKSVLITLGEKGMALFQDDGEVFFTGTRARKVADVSGAGDTVIATVTYALCGGASFKEAIFIANFAAGVVCGEVGVVPIQIERLKETINRGTVLGDVVMD